jgi:hypothetical protein
MLTLLALIFIVVLSGAKAFFDALHETRKLRFVDPKGARDASDTFSSDFIRSCRRRTLHMRRATRKLWMASKKGLYSLEIRRSSH